MSRRRRFNRSSKARTSNVSLPRVPRCWSNRPTSCPITGMLMYQDIRADGYNNFQEQPGGPCDLSTLRPTRAVPRLLPACESQSRVHVAVRHFDLGHQLLETARSCSLPTQPKHFRTSTILRTWSMVRTSANYIQNLYVETDPTNQISEEFAADFDQFRALGVGWRTVFCEARLGLHHLEPSTRVRDGSNLRSCRRRPTRWQARAPRALPRR